MKMKLTPVFLLATLALAALIPAVLGISPASLAGTSAVLLASTLFIERSKLQNRVSSLEIGTVGIAFERKRGLLAQLGSAGEDPGAGKIEREYRKVQNELKHVGDDIKAYATETKESMQEVRARLQAVEQVVARNGTLEGFHSSDVESVGSQVMKEMQGNTAFAALKDWNQGTCRVKLASSIRAALVTEGWGDSEDATIPSNPEQRGVVGPVLRPLRLLDVLQSRPVKTDSVEFVQIQSSGDAAEQVKHGDEKQEIEFEGVPVRAEIVTVAGHTTAARQVLADSASLQSNIDLVLKHKCTSRLEHQIINGSGEQGKINGLLNQATVFVPTVGETPADKVGEAITTLKNAGYQPGLVILNPLAWFGIQITKTTTDEDYVFGSPTAPIKAALWNVIVIESPSMPQDKALVLDSSLVTVLDREEPNVMLSNSHKDYFTKNLVAILGELRAGLEVLDQYAVYSVDISSVSASE